MPAPNRSKLFKLILIAFTLSLLLAIRLPFNTIYLGYFEVGCDRGNCRTFYTVQSDNIVIKKTSTDTSSNVYQTITGDFDDIRLNAPLLMLFNVSGKYGCPDCGDQGGYVLGFKLFGVKYLYEMEKGEEPWYFHDATSMIDDRLKALKEMEKGIKP